MAKLLLVEDDKGIQEFNKELLEDHGYTVTLAMNLKEARERFALDPPDLIILDVMLPDGSGFDWLTELRQTSRVPVMMLTAKGRLADRMTGYDTGADYYLPKPYDYEEFAALIGTLLKRTEQMPERITRGALSLDVLSGQAFLNDKDLLLAKKEFALLLLFVQNENKVITAEHIYAKTWGQPMAGDTQALDAALSRLRKKLTGCGYVISVVYKNGYRFECDERL